MPGAETQERALVNNLSCLWVRALGAGAGGGGVSSCVRGNEITVLKHKKVRLLRPLLGTRDAITLYRARPKV